MSYRLSLLLLQRTGVADSMSTGRGDAGRRCGGYPLEYDGYPLYMIHIYKISGEKPKETGNTCLGFHLLRDLGVQFETLTIV